MHLQNAKKIMHVMDGAVRFSRWFRARMDNLLFLGTRLLENQFAVTSTRRQRRRLAGQKVNDNQDDRSWAARYRVGASEARQRAETVQGENTRQVLLGLAVKYDELAEDLEQRMAARVPADLSARAITSQAIFSKRDSA